MDETEVITVFAFMRCDAVLCRAALVIGKWRSGESVCWVLAVVCLVGGGWQLDGDTIFPEKTKGKSPAGIQKVAPILVVV
ncbi:hypothetical protein ACDZ29_02815 [Peribacillus sp. RS7]|uniref:hypothetical protein n=1 Tax=Peribacillus sp. RS7 TaxID=3242679 RepID=UPI0035C16E6F